MTSVSSSKAPQVLRYQQFQQFKTAQTPGWKAFSLMSPIHYPVSNLTACLSPLLTTFGRNFPVTQLFRRPDRKTLGQAEPLHSIGTFLGSTFSTPIFSVPKETITQLVVLVVCSISL
jgi:hypothetical protein